MPDAIFADPRLARIYDPLDPDRRDLDAYVGMADEFGAASVLDVGCGTGTLACMLVERGLDVVGVDPAAASLDVARTKPGAENVRWIHRDATELSALEADLAVMTGNVAEVFIADADFVTTLRGIGGALRPGGRLVFEVRDPARKEWQGWNRAESHAVVDVPGEGPIEHWVDLISVDLPLVSFRWTYRFVRSGDVLTSDSTLRFRSRDEVAERVDQSGLEVVEVRDAPDRPGLEHVFVCRNTRSP